MEAIVDEQDSEYQGTFPFFVYENWLFKKKLFNKYIESKLPFCVALLIEIV